MHRLRLAGPPFCYGWTKWRSSYAFTGRNCHSFFAIWCSTVYLPMQDSTNSRVVTPVCGSGAKRSKPVSKHHQTVTYSYGTHRTFSRFEEHRDVFIDAYFIWVVRGQSPNTQQQQLRVVIHVGLAKQKRHRPVSTAPGVHSTKRPPFSSVAMSYETL